MAFFPRPLLFLCCCALSVPPLAAQEPPTEAAEKLRAGLAEVQRRLTAFETAHPEMRTDTRRRLADCAVGAKGVDWILRHAEFYKPNYVEQAERALALAGSRLTELEQLTREEPGAVPSWENRAGSTVLGYFSRVDRSVQPYAVSLPAGYDPEEIRRWPLHVVLHGRAGQLNEVNFVHQHEGKPAPAEQTWVQLDVFGRTNNAYRWAGETDVFEALDDLQRRFRIDHRRITLRGFSMGGAGAWHLGLHHPSLWSSVGAGAGFVDFYKYQKVKEPLPAHQHRTLGIYDAVDYALNAAMVPVCTYGGELDPQLLASTTMVEAAKPLGVEMKLLVGPQTEHKFHPESLKEFMAFHAEHTERGRPPHPGPSRLRFTTRTLKYNRCQWLTLEEMLVPYEPAVVESKADENFRVVISTKNVGALQIDRGLAEEIVLDDQTFGLLEAAGGLLPGVYFVREEGKWSQLDYAQSRAFEENPGLHKRHNLQGPIDDAFMESFLCVRGTGEPWNAEHEAWARARLARFEQEFDKHLRGRAPVIADSELTEEHIENHHLILFGDPGSNRLLARLLEQLPLEWTRERFTLGGKEYDPARHGVAMIYPNPLHPRRYVVLNSGHTFGAKEFNASNAQLYPRLGDCAVLRFTPTAEGRYQEETLFAEIFDSHWKLPR